MSLSQDKFSGLDAPKLSIITICRNEKLIENTCRSICAQVFDEFEWLVIDGASTDNTVDVLNNYRNRMTYFVSEPDSGRYQAMNKGISRARGEYLLFLNGGDYLADPFVLERLFRYDTDNALLAKFRPRLQADIIFGEVITRETGFLPWPLWPIGPRRLDRAYFKKYSLPHQATFIRRRVFEQIGAYDERFESAGDYEWFMRAILANRASYEYVPLVIAVYNFAGMSSREGVIKDSSARREQLRAYKKYANRLSVVWRAFIDSAVRRRKKQPQI